MPITGIIPGIKPPGETLASIPGDVQKMWLMQAQAQKAKGEAAQSNMIASLLNGGNIGPSTSEMGTSGGASNNLSNGGMNLQKALTIYGALKWPVPTPVDGVYHTAFGDFPAGETPSQKSGRKVTEAVETEKGKKGLKRAQDLEDIGTFIEKTAEHAAALSDFYNKGFKSGPRQAAQQYLKFPSEGAGIFAENATPLIAGPSKELSTRGGAIIARMVQGSKPDYSQPDKYNKEVLEQIHRQTYRAFMEAKKEYEDLTGKPYPKKLPKFYENVRVVSPKGHIVVKPPEEAKKLMSKYPGSKILGNAYE
jgi:hypothetical protein